MRTALRKVGFLIVGLGFVPAVFAAEAQTNFEGNWVGNVTAPNATTPIAFNFVPRDGKLLVNFSMPAMFVDRMNLGPSEFAGGKYVMPALGVELALQDDELTGTFANPLLRVSLHRSQESLQPLADVSPSALPPKPTWQHAIGAKIWASPIAREGVIYLGSVDGKFHALSAKDGHEIWAWSESTTPIYFTAIATEKAVTFLNAAAECVQLDRSSGKLRWKASLGQTSVTATKDPTFNHRGPTPVIDAGEIFIPAPDGRIFCLDAESGTTRWTADLGAPLFASITIDGNRLLAATFAGDVIALDRRTHQELHRVRLGGPIASAPVVAGETIVVGCRDYLLYGLSHENLSTKWRDSFWFSWVESVPRVVDGVAYIGGSDFRRISAIDPSTGQSRWARDVGGLTWGTPVITETQIFAGTSAQNPAAIQHRGGIAALERETGKLLWRYPVELPKDSDRAGFIGSLLIVGNQLIGAGYDGTIVALPIDSSSSTD